MKFIYQKQKKCLNFKYFSNEEFFYLFQKLKNEKGINFLVDKLFLNNNTILRWNHKKSIPQQYFFDLLQIENNKKLINSYIQIISARNKDQFFTKKEVAKNCFNTLIKFLKKFNFDYSKYFFIEPSAGDGAFFDLLPSKKRIGIDLFPPNDRQYLKANYLDWNNPYKKSIVITNPPFGLRGNLALRFINHSFKSDIVAMILPPLFESDGKGTPKKRVLNHKLVYSEKLDLNSYLYPNGKEVSVATLFQIWVKKDLPFDEIKSEYDTDHLIKIYSISNGNTSSDKRNVKMIGKCDLYLPSTCFKGMRIYKRFEDLPNKRGYGIVILNSKFRYKTLKIFNKIDWEKNYAFLSTNSALNLRMNLIKKALLENLKI